MGDVIMDSENHKKIVIGTTSPEVLPGGIPAFISDIKKLEEYSDHIFYEFRNNENVREKSLGRFSRRRLLRFLISQWIVAKASLHAREIEVHSMRSGIVAVIFFSKKVTFFFHGPGFQEAAVENKSSLIIFLFFTLELIFLRRASRLKCASFAFRRRLVENYSISENKIKVVRPRQAVQLTKYRKILKTKLEQCLKERKIRCIVCRRLVKRTGVIEFLKSFNKDQLDHVEIYVVGHGPESEVIAQIVEENENIFFLHGINDFEKKKVYKQSVFNIIPTKYLEGLGMVVYEGIEFGAMPIATNIDGLPEIIKELGVGIIVDDIREINSFLNFDVISNQLNILNESV
jgi:glycosyltransferase involved in cell wall biosynthesis